jgi:hypothetical protein
MTDFDDTPDAIPDPRIGPQTAASAPSSAAAPVAAQPRLVTLFEAAAADHPHTDPPTSWLADRLCQAVVQVTGVQGSAISVYLGADLAIPIGASDLAATMGEALQFTVREGPCFSSYAQRQPVLAPDLRSNSTAWSSWPTFADQLLRHTAYQGVFAYPLLKRGLAMGSLSLYRTADGEPERLDEFSEIAACVTEKLLNAEMLISVDGEPEFPWMNGPTAQPRRQVWLAQGLTLQANRITPGQALELLRARAFSEDRLLDDLAEDIVAGRVPAPVLESQQ